MPEVIGIGLHGKAVYTHHGFLLFVFLGRRIIIVTAIGAGNFQYLVRNIILPGAVAFHNSLDQVLRYVLIVGQQLLGIFGQAVAAVAEGGVVIVIAHPGIQGDAFDDGGSIQAFYFRIGIQFVEIGYAQGQIGVHKQLGGFRFRQAHEENINGVLDGSLL